MLSYSSFHLITVIGSVGLREELPHGVVIYRVAFFFQLFELAGLGVYVPPVLHVANRVFHLGRGTDNHLG